MQINGRISLGCIYFVPLQMNVVLFRQNCCEGRCEFLVVVVTYIIVCIQGIFKLTLQILQVDVTQLDKPKSHYKVCMERKQRDGIVWYVTVT